MMSTTESGAAARAYIEAVGARVLASLEALLDDQVVATFSGARLGKREWIEASRRLLPVLVRNDIREAFVAGERACIVYDFVTDTPAGAVVCVELVTVSEGRITAVELVLDRVAFSPVQAVLRERASQQ